MVAASFCVSLTVSAALRKPVAVGVKATLTVQLALAFSVAPQVVVAVKSAALKLAVCPVTAANAKVTLVTAAEEVFVTVKTDWEVAPPTRALQKV
jgi:hypothetical protein